ncbi:MAG: type I DNA topoisomerase [bacterium]|nr:type I DNA topoisomerase [bacterium]
MRLVIVESPAKGRTIESFLGKDYQVLSSYGHIRDLPKGKLGIDVEKDFEPTYVIPTKARKTATALKNAAKKATEVILASDEDREGEAIAWHVAQLLELKNPKRIVFHEITKPAIEEALQHPRTIDENRVNAQQTRRILDRLVGYNLSPFLWKKVSRGLSAGRVQSVVVRLIADREEEIKKFIAKEYWSVEAKLQQRRTTQNATQNNAEIFSAQLTKKDGKAIEKLEIKDKKEADLILKNLKEAKYKVAKVEQKEVKRNPLPPFTTSTMQQASGQRLHFPAKLTMQLAQQLYEQGFITYHRTDSLSLSQLALNTAKAFIQETYGTKYWAGFERTFKTKSKGAQEAHEAIRPTQAQKTPDSLGLTGPKAKLYELIWQRFLASQMASAQVSATSIDIQTVNNQQSTIPAYTFHATGQMMQFDGFLKVYPIKFEETELPLLKNGEILFLKELLSLQHFTQPQARYTEASLIKALEENGIGRPSTYAPTISTVQDRGYVQKDEQRRLAPTELGQTVNGILTKHFPKIVDIGFTASMEEGLDEIAKGEKEWVPMLKEFYTPFSENLQKKYEEVKKEDVIEVVEDKKCPKCGFSMVIRFGRFGKFYACSKFPECRHTEPLEKNQPKSLGITCLKCSKGDIVAKPTKRGKIFYGCNKYPECDFALWDKPTGEVCKECGSLLIQTKKDIVKCSNKECKSLPSTKSLK